MNGDLQNPPDDAETLKAMIADMRRSQSSLQADVAALRAASADAQARIDRLQLLLKTIHRATYGRSSEKLDENQYAFTFEEVQTGLGTVDAMLQKLSPGTCSRFSSSTSGSASRTMRWNGRYAGSPSVESRGFSRLRSRRPTRRQHLFLNRHVQTERYRSAGLAR